VALLNLLLLEWHVGNIRDEEFQERLQNEFNAVEPEVA